MGFQLAPKSMTLDDRELDGRQAEGRHCFQILKLAYLRCILRLYTT